jgi:hypothetical protein
MHWVLMNGRVRLRDVARRQVLCCATENTVPCVGGPNIGEKLLPLEAMLCVHPS